MKRKKLVLLFLFLSFNVYSQNLQNDTLDLKLNIQRENNLVKIQMILTINNLTEQNLYFNIFSTNKVVSVYDDTVKIEYIKIGNLKAFEGDTLFFDLNFFHTGGSTWDGSAPPPGLNVFFIPFRKKYTLIFIERYYGSKIQKPIPIICKFDLFTSYEDAMDIYKKSYKIYEKRKQHKTIGLTKSFILLKNLIVKNGSLDKKYSKIIKIPTFY